MSNENKYLPIHHTEKKLLLHREFEAILNRLINFSNISGSGFAIDAYGNTQETKTSGYAVMFTDTPFDNSKRRELVSSAVRWLLAAGSLRHLVGDIEAERVSGLWWQTRRDAFFDLGVNVQKWSDAVKLAKHYKQRAIWCYKTKSAIDTDAMTVGG